jgi:hypothetical protein
MIVIVDHVTPKDEDSTGAVVKTAENIEADIKELLRCGLRWCSITASDGIAALLGRSTRIYRKLAPRIDGWLRHTKNLI